MIESLQSELVTLLREEGAALVGIGNLERVENCDLPVGISVAVPVPVKTVKDLKSAPTLEYKQLYDSLNADLNRIVKAGERFLREHGYRALARSTDVVKVDANNHSGLPHKTVATRAGLGWIGKNNLLVTPEYGCAVRISSLLTDAPLETAEPILTSRCGGCHLCVDACPGQVLTGKLWQAGMAREELVDIWKCYETQLRIMEQATGVVDDLCGRCFAVCARTQKYLRSEG